ncbi:MULTISPECIES: hypothetical protein [unclassified Aeromicrobium]|uniref:hypothetical protein n=1 Tax=unclassified Aeromicrobium TaxID=2633570 RepID=UPI000ACF91A4|nr:MULTISPECIES: hypothetical protein [unclassified Aeromicrobium]MBD8608492.1 hypothetical protein [Aeromicrobium sp. CFBP 8757]
MNRLITRPLLMLSASGLALAVAVAPVKVSAAEVDQGAVEVASQTAPPVDPLP